LLGAHPFQINGAMSEAMEPSNCKLLPSHLSHSRAYKRSPASPRVRMYVNARTPATSHLSCQCHLLRRGCLLLCSLLGVARHGAKSIRRSRGWSLLKMEEAYSLLVSHPTPEPLARGRLWRPRSRSQPPPEVAPTAAAAASPAVAATPGRRRRRAGMARPTDLLSRGGVVCKVERVEAKRQRGGDLQRSPACCGEAKRRRRGPCRRWRFPWRRRRIPCGGGAAWRWRRLIPGAVGAVLAAAAAAPRAL
jgi:hypothetical protein